MWLAVFAATALSDLITYCVTAFQLAWAFPDPVSGFPGSLTKFMGIFAVTQIPLAISEGLLTVLIMTYLVKYSRSELDEIGVSAWAERGGVMKKLTIITIVVLAVVIALAHRGIGPEVRLGVRRRGLGRSGGDHRDRPQLQALVRLAIWIQSITTNYVMFGIQGVVGAALLFSALGYFVGRTRGRAEAAAGKERRCRLEP